MAVIRDKLKYAGNILQYFIDDNVEDNIAFGEVRKKAFSLVTKEDIKKISQHLDEKDFDMLDYEWQYTDKHSRKIAGSIRRLFIAIDIECDPEQPAICQQIKHAKDELEQTGRISSIDQRVILKNDRKYLIENKEVHSQRFEFYLYKRIHKMLETEVIYVTESEANKRLDDDLIKAPDWKSNKKKFVDNTGLDRLTNPISTTLEELESTLDKMITRVTHNINADANEFVKRQPKSNQLAWSLAHKRWKDAVYNPIYNQLEHMSIIEIKQLNYDDDMLSHWGVQHLHLSSEIENDGYVKRTRELLFVLFRDTKAYLIGIFDHNSWCDTDIIKIIHYNWPKELTIFKTNSDTKKLTSQEYKTLRSKNACSTIVMDDGTEYLSPAFGVTSNGAPISATLNSNNIIHTLNTCV